MDIEQQQNISREENIRKVFGNHHSVSIEFVKSLFKKRSRYSHKGTYGHTLICAGSYGKMGAAVLATGAALRSGTGLVTTCIPTCGYDIMQISNPEAMVVVSGEKHLTKLPDVTRYNSIAIGTGMGTDEETEKFLAALLNQKLPALVADADALNMLSAHPSYLTLLPSDSILTPHEGEFKRLVGEWRSETHQLELLKNLSAGSRSVVVLKGPDTAIVSPTGECFTNTTGNAGMAKGGSGDVLTGVIAALLAQQYTALHAAIIGVFVHGMAGDIAKQKIGETGMKAGDIVEQLPSAFRHLE